ncbi:hypothetical protein HG531_013846 [Fusarium graminearum]|nr:hypothetical protein HG531_013846 [Fusarium graminearum]
MLVGSGLELSLKVGSFLLDLLELGGRVTLSLGQGGGVLLGELLLGLLGSSKVLLGSLEVLCQTIMGCLERAVLLLPLSSIILGGHELGGRVALERLIGLLKVGDLLLELGKLTLKRLVGLLKRGVLGLKIRQFGQLLLELRQLVLRVGLVLVVCFLEGVGLLLSLGEVLLGSGDLGVGLFLDIVEGLLESGGRELVLGSGQSLLALVGSAGSGSELFLKCTVGLGKSLVLLLSLRNLGLEGVDLLGESSLEGLAGLLGLNKLSLEGGELVGNGLPLLLETLELLLGGSER